VAVQGIECLRHEAVEEAGRQGLIQRFDHLQQRERSDLVGGTEGEVGAAAGSGRGLELRAQVLGVVVDVLDREVRVRGLEGGDVLLEARLLLGSICSQMSTRLRLAAFCFGAQRARPAAARTPAASSPAGGLASYQPPGLSAAPRWSRDRRGAEAQERYGSTTRRRYRCSTPRRVARRTRRGQAHRRARRVRRRRRDTRRPVARHSRAGARAVRASRRRRARRAPPRPRQGRHTRSRSDRASDWAAARRAAARHRPRPAVRPRPTGPGTRRSSGWRRCRSKRCRRRRSRPRCRRRTTSSARSAARSRRRAAALRSARRGPPRGCRSGTPCSEPPGSPRPP